MTKSYKLITLILILISNKIRHVISPCSTYNDCSSYPSTPCCGHNGQCVVLYDIQCTITYLNANQCTCPPSILTTTTTTTTTTGIGINGTISDGSQCGGMSWLNFYIQVGGINNGNNKFSKDLF